ncbi:hypothetical protein FRACYDRAFT_181752 [Fragilariopsis cylindrus CCMP1102]|uniref:Wax synthase domain-containing protein n=1 Tax=Fragilariopsis cylindrus CCMP1102 TaxID=635003 RepID=A0A1E7FPA9_9STRA|nr:hypothetical protein FRACYDRAFT_181752 [Fragilariopsis cylindrus CCMP1102]|eukprot:OEU19977.1 hypothetical protein FRACYDRAFT_181752 [Fragilariopsis cylindrus CCMP1102]
METDNRPLLFTFFIPSSITTIIDSFFYDGTSATVTTPKEYGFFLMSIGYWIELLILILITLIVAAFVGLILYYTIIQSKQTNTTHAYIVGWGLILPFWISYPVILLYFFDIRNCLFKFLVGCIAPVVCVFRTTECIYGFVPMYSTRSLQEFLFYYATIPIVSRIKKKPKQHDDDNCAGSKKINHLIKFIGWLFLTGVLQSILSPYPYFAPFGGINGSHRGYDGHGHDWYAVERYFTWQLYANSSLQALLFQLYLTTYGEAMALVFTVLTGYEAEPVMDNPLLESTSPSDFWGRRWNLIVHTVLKNGVYKPVRKYFGRTTAVLTTFLTSGIFHEWILYVVFGSGNSQQQQLYQPIYGTCTVFFLWQAVLIGLELTVGKSYSVCQVCKILPRPIKTSIIIFSGVMFAHFFLDPYIRRSFFDHGAIGLPMIVPLRR